MTFNKLPNELKMYICEFLLHTCYLCEDKNRKYFDNEIYKCFLISTDYIYF